MIFVSPAYPYLRILIQQGEAEGTYAQFQGGKLELDAGDPGYEDVLAEAQRNPSISILVNETTCRLCGEVFTGKGAKMLLGAHVKKSHPDVWDAEKALEQAESRDRTLKERSGFPCDVCQPTQTFGSASDLAEHVTDLHTRPPEMDDEGNETGAGKGRPGEATIPAAVASHRNS